MQDKLLKQAQELQRRMEQVQKDLERQEVTGYSGGGVVELTLTGKLDPKSLKINPSVFKGSLSEEELSKLDLTMLEDLILVAFKDAKDRVEKQVQEQMSGITGGLNLPDFGL